MGGRVIALAALLACAAVGARAAPLEAYGRPPQIEQAAISPDGARLALVVTDGEQRSVVIETAADGKMVATIAAGQQKLRDVRWAGDEHLLITGSSTEAPEHVFAERTEWWVVVDYDVKTRLQRQLLADVPRALGMQVVEAEPQVRIVGGDPLAFVVGVQWRDGTGVPSLYQVDLDTDRSQMRREGDRFTSQWLVGRAGAPVARTEYDPGAGAWSLLLASTGWQAVKTLARPIGHPVLLGFARDDRSLLIGDSEQEQDMLRELAPGATDWGEPTPVRDDLELIFDPATGAQIGAHALVGDADNYSFFDPADQAAWKATVKAFPGQRVTLASITADHRKLVVEADSPTAGPAYYLVDLSTGQASTLGQVYAGLGAADIGLKIPIAFNAGDGLPLTGYLTFPSGRTGAKNLPLVVLAHGGPAARDAPGFDWWSQALASRGYAVLQVNFRGSGGFGLDFLHAGFGQWGRKMQTDLSDGVRYLVHEGTVDPKRVCIVGASYGGYAALAGATLDLGVYRCAVDVEGISDPKRFIAWSKDRHSVAALRYWDRFMGAKSPADPALADISPLAHASAATIPVLIIHGRDDTVVPFDQSQQMADALQRAGKDVELTPLAHEDHWLSGGATRLQMLQATAAFLQKNNPSDAAGLAPDAAVAGR